MRRRTFLVAAAVWLFAAGAARAQQSSTYLALGDSYAYGYTSFEATQPSMADQGYVAPFADFLATQNGGVRPVVVNLALPGETTMSFLTGGNDWASVNTNYAGGYTSQAAAAAAFLRGQGDAVSTITLQLGGNDIIGLFVTPEFLGADEAGRQTLLSAALDQMETGYAAALSLLRAESPNSRIFTVGYFDAFAGLGAFNPVAAYSTPLTLEANRRIAAQSALYGAQFVDLVGAFSGREAELSSILTIDQGFPNFHPNEAGYQVIAQQLAVAAATPAAIPEPATVVVILTGLPLLAASARRRARL
jgi:lysophospholipase L1-like esterase